MSDERVKDIYDESRKRRVAIFRRPSGSYFYEVEYFSEHPSELCRVPTRQRIIGFYESQDRAESEARANLERPSGGRNV